MKKVHVNDDIWGHDLNSEQSESGVVVGDNIWQIARKGDIGYMVAEDGGIYYLSGHSESDEDIVAAGAYLNSDDLNELFTEIVED